MFRAVLFIVLFFQSLSLLAQSSLKGHISNAKGEDLPGVTIRIQDGFRGTSSDAKGFFEIHNVSEDQIIVEYTSIGFKTRRDTLDQSDLSQELSIALEVDVYLADELIVSATRVGNSDPIPFTNIDKEKIQEMNTGRDLPYIIAQSPSVVATSDAGAGIGYSALRIRGIDQTNINVTINGIALNDAESHGVYWVDAPDFSSSVSDIQIQRGVGTSTNGAGAFGSTINMQTEKRQEEAYSEVLAGLGSFNTYRGTFKFGTGILNKVWSFDGRLSKIQSDGYIDRAHSKLESYYLSGGFNNGRTSVKLLAFGGYENTYQAWNGIDRETMKVNRTDNSAGAIYNPDWSVKGYYENQVDDYRQNHYQLLINQKLNATWRLNLAGHYTKGSGYYESFRQDAAYANYYLSPVNGDSTTDVIDREWLDNDYYGMTYNLNYLSGDWKIDFGGAANQYSGDHFGEIIWIRQAGSSNKDDEFYRNNGLKNDFNTYIKVNKQLTSNMSLFVDLQYRHVNYRVDGTDKYYTALNIKDEHNFFNPKFGLNYDLNASHHLYYSIAKANREPNRNDYTNAPNFEAKPEELIDNELGYRFQKSENWFQANAYYMYYQDQLVLTGEINDVGEPLRNNVGKSYRAGLELSAQVFLLKDLKWMPNISLSSNRNIDYNSVEVNGDFVTKNSPLAYSPDLIANNAFQLHMAKHFYWTVYSYFVGSQFMNNSGEDYSKMDAYHYHDMRFEFRKAFKKVRSLGIYANINNFLDANYESNGYLWGTTQYLYPQAGINYMLGMNLKF